MISAGEVAPARAARRTSSGSRRSRSRSPQAYGNLRPGRGQGPRRRADPRARPRGGTTSPRWPPAASRSIGEIGLGSVKTGAAGRADGRVGAGRTGWSRRSTPAGRRSPGRTRSARTRSSRRSPHIAGHINGGTTSMSEPDIDRLVGGDARIALELVHCGNGRTALYALAPGARTPARSARVDPRQRRPVRDRRRPARDPAADGPPRLARRGRARDRRRAGDRQHGPRPRPRRRRHRAGSRRRPRASSMRPIGSVGDDGARGAGESATCPGISMILIDGVPVIGRSRNTAAGRRARPRSSRDRPSAAGGH